MRFSNCTPNLDFSKPTFLLENNGLPFEGLLRARVKQYAKDLGAETEEAKSIFYKNRNDVEALQAYKCICGRSFGNKTLSKPNLDHFGSNEFCFESWQEKNMIDCSYPTCVPYAPCDTNTSRRNTIPC